MDYLTLILLGVGGYVVYKKYIKKAVEAEEEEETTAEEAINQSYDTIATELQTQTEQKDYVLVPKAWDTLYLSYNSLLRQDTGAFNYVGQLLIDNFFNYKKYSASKKIEFAKDKTYNVIAEAMIKLYPGTKYKVYTKSGLLETDAFALNNGYLKVYFFKVQSGRPTPEPVLQYWKEWGKITLDEDLNPFTIVPSLDIIKQEKSNQILTLSMDGNKIPIYQQYIFYDSHTMVKIFAASKYNSAWIDLSPKSTILTTSDNKTESTALIKQTTGTTSNKTITLIRS